MEGIDVSILNTGPVIGDCLKMGDVGGDVNTLDKSAEVNNFKDEVDKMVSKVDEVKLFS